MSSDNPYQTPKSDVRAVPVLEPEVARGFEKMALGQKLVIYAVLLYFIAAVLRVAIGPAVLVIWAASLLLSLVGLVMILSARKSHIAVKIILFLLLFVPLINILVLLRINNRATKELREAGYTVGFMGAAKREAKA